MYRGRNRSLLETSALTLDLPMHFERSDHLTDFLSDRAGRDPPNSGCSAYRLANDPAFAAVAETSPMPPNAIRAGILAMA